MGQINIGKGNNSASPVDTMGYSFTESGIPIVIDELGNETPLSTISQYQPNVIANKGVGIQADLPSVGFVANDVYVTTDTFKVYLADNTITWSSSALGKGQLVTDILTDPLHPIIYQYITDLIPISSFVITDNIDFTLIAFDEDGISTTTISSVHNFYYDLNYKYTKRLDDYWIRTKIHKEVTPSGGLPE